MIKVTEGGEKEQRTCNASKACGIKIKNIHHGSSQDSPFKGIYCFLQCSIMYLVCIIIEEELAS